MIAENEVTAIADLIQQRGLSEALVSELRTLYPGKHFTYCMDDDIHSGKPVIERSGFRIYLVDSSDHCSQLTSVVETASGFVLAEVLGD